MKTHFLTHEWFKQICLRAPLALMVRHFGANLQEGGGMEEMTRARRTPRGMDST